MLVRIPESEIARIAGNAIQTHGIFRKEDTSALFYNLSFLENRIHDLKHLFPKNSLHSIAIKANPLFKIMKIIRALGVGNEAASLPELQLSLEAGYEPSFIVFNSPCKTMEEIEFALEKNIHTNADSLEELERIDLLLKKISSKSSIGVRINPQVGTGAIKSTSVAGHISKFGVPIDSNREALKECFRKYPWLTGVHLHIGSQGIPLELLTRGVRRVMDLSLEVNNEFNIRGKGNRISTFDIGGGLPVSYRFGAVPVSMQEYRSALEKEVPELFSGNFRIITEFGRYIHTNAAWAISRIEYVKREKGYTILITHLGADFMIRECYNPQDWHHEITVLDPQGKPKDASKKEKYIIAGPLCFAGDIIGYDLELPLVNEGDYIVFHDIGAYTMSMWSRYNSRQTPMVLGYQNDNEGFEVLKEREDVAKVMDFWK
jgi:diaminopimelate decarboxylase